MFESFSYIFGQLNNDEIADVRLKIKVIMD